MRNAGLVLLLCGIPTLAAAGWGDCDHQAPRHERLDGAGVRSVRVNAGAGSLRIEGRAGATSIEVNGTACASSASVLDDIRIRAVLSGSVATIETEMPGTASWLGGGEARLDLVIEVPPGVTLDVEDGSGEMQIRNVAAATVKDGSGEMVLEAIAGEVRITDGSGGITVRDAGSVVIEEDGSGGIDIGNVRGNVLVRDDGSGGIAVHDVGGDFTVEDDGSGGITHDAVQGRVRIPSRH
jgi:hypothetical protein